MEQASTSLGDETPEAKRLKLGEKKRYYCTVAGCGRDYSRAEHLYRHQLNRKRHPVHVLVT